MGTLEPRSVIQSTRYIARHKARRVSIFEAEALAVDPVKKTVDIADNSVIRGAIDHMTIPYDILVYAVGSEVQTFGIPGVQEVSLCYSVAFRDDIDFAPLQHSNFLKELPDAEKVSS